MPKFPANVSDEAATISLARELADTLESGDVIALCGGLGAGKTHFSKGIVSGLEADDLVTSPTFSLVNEYRSGRLPVFHFDFYRLETADELIRIGWDEYLDEDGVIIVEWADRFPALLPDTTLWLDLTVEEDGSRSIHRR